MATDRQWPRNVIRLLLAAAVLAAAYVGVAWWSGRQIPASVSVEGVSVGGMSVEQASERLTAQLATKAKAPITVTSTDLPSFTVDPVGAGLALDIPGTLDGLVGFTLNPAIVWERLTAHTDRPVRTTVDRALLTDVVTARAKTVATQPVEGSVTLTDGTVKVSPAKTGATPAIGEAVDAIADRWPRTASVSTSANQLPPAISQAAIDEAVRTFATPALSAPVTIVVGDKTAALAPAAYAPALSLQPVDGKLVPKIDEDLARTKILEATAAFQTAPKDAQIVLQGGAPVVVPSADGVTIDVATAPAGLLAAMTATDRRLTLAPTVAKPALTTEAATALGVKEVVASFDSVFPNDGVRTTNIAIASRTINGTLLKPGDTFSMNGILGQRTVAKGYGEANTIVNGRLTPGVGGGISQVSTVLYNLSYFAGLELIEHHPHSFYISRYPEGREATVSWPNVDNKFKNNTQYGVLLQLTIEGSAIKGRVWSTKQFEVESIKGPRVNIQQPRSLVDSGPRCVSQSPVVGFDVTVTRVIRKGGAEIKRENVTTRYQPEDQVSCT